MGLLRLVLVVLPLTMSQCSVQRTINVAVGGTLVLELDPKPPTVDRVMWLHGNNLVADLSFGSFSYYGTFRGHTVLEISGRLTISNITLEEGGAYKVEVNHVWQDMRYDIRVYEVLTRPLTRVTPQTCGTNLLENCTLVCELEPEPSTAVSYEWELEGEVSKISGKKLTINYTTKATNFTCWAKNPVSQEASESIKNPFLQELTFSKPTSRLELGLGLTAAFVVLLLGVAGVFYFKKKYGISDLNPGTAT